MILNYSKTENHSYRTLIIEILKIYIDKIMTI